MKKGILSFGLLLIAACVFLVGTNAADDLVYMGDVTKDGYYFAEPDGCLGCAHQSSGWKNNTHLENCVGIKGAVDTHGEAEEDDIEITGVGWISSKHAYSQDGASRNYYCSICHAPSFEKVTTDPTKTKAFKKKDMSPGMSCIGCHPSHGQAAVFGTRFANLEPGTDGSDNANWLPRHIEDGKQANKQCEFCHGKYHGFVNSVIGGLHEGMVKKGTLRCVDCHMAVYNTLEGGTHERYHNMKVFANGPDSCSNNGACHDFKKKDMDDKIPLIYQAHTQKKHKAPSIN